MVVKLCPCISELLQVVAWEDVDRVRMGIPAQRNDKASSGSPSGRIPQRQSVERRVEQSQSALEAQVLETISESGILRGARPRESPRRRSREERLTRRRRFEQGGLNFVFESETLPDSLAENLSEALQYLRSGVRDTPIHVGTFRVIRDVQQGQGERVQYNPITHNNDRRGRLDTIRRVIQEHENTMNRVGGSSNDEESQSLADLIANGVHGLTPQQLHACSLAFKAVDNLLTNVAERVNAQSSNFDEVSKTVQYAQTILGIEPGNENLLRDPRSIAVGDRDMVNVFIQRHQREPSWRNDNPDDILAAFHDAIERGDLECMLNLIPRLSYDISHMGSSGDCALHVACSYGRGEIAQLLIDMGHSPDQLCEDRSTPLADAAGGGYPDLVRYLTRRTPACVTMADVDGDTPLHNAARGDHVECCKILLAGGADIHALNNNGEKPKDLSPPGSASRALLSSRYAELPQTERQVLDIFQFRRNLADSTGFNISDIVSLSNDRISRVDALGSVCHLESLGVLSQTMYQHWKIASLSILDDPTL